MYIISIMSLVVGYSLFKLCLTCGLGSADTVTSSLVVLFVSVCFPLSLILADFLEPAEGWGSSSVPPSFPPPPPPPFFSSLLVLER